MSATITTKLPHSSSPNSSSSSIIFDRRQNIKEKRQNGYHQQSSSSDYCDKNNLNNDDLSRNFTLPIVGSKIRPRKHTDRWSRLNQQPNQRICKLMHATSNLPNVQKLQSQSDRNQSDAVIDSAARLSRRHRSVSLIKDGKLYDRIDSNLNNRMNKVDENHLMQRVMRLQRESQRKDAEISHLRHKIFLANEDENSIKNTHDFYQNVVDKTENEHVKLKSLPDNLSKPEFDKMKNEKLILHNFIQIMTTFFTVCCTELEAINQRMTNVSVRDYGDVFTEAAKALQEPFSFRLMEINTKCSTAFDQLSLNAVEKEQLYVQFDRFLKEKIYPISKVFDAIMPVLKDAAVMARESVRACSAFSQWSREFGDQLQLQPNWELMSYKVDDLQMRFREYGIPKHWLPSSLMPLLRIIIYEYKNRCQEYSRKEANYIGKISTIEEKLRQLKSQLSPNEQTIIEEIISYGQENENIKTSENITEENHKLRGIIAQLEQKLQGKSNEILNEYAVSNNQKNVLERATTIVPVTRVPSHTSIDRNFVSSMEDRYNLHSSNPEPASDDEDVYRNSSTNESNFAKVPLLQDENLQTNIQYDNEVDNNNNKGCMRRSIEPKLPDSPKTNMEIENLIPSAGCVAQFKDTDRDRLSECSNGSISKSEQMSSISDKIENSLSSDERAEAPTNAAAIASLNELNQLYEELSEERKKSLVKKVNETYANTEDNQTADKIMNEDNTDYVENIEANQGSEYEKEKINFTSKNNLEDSSEIIESENTTHYKNEHFYNNCNNNLEKFRNAREISISMTSPQSQTLSQASQQSQISKKSWQNDSKSEENSRSSSRKSISSLDSKSCTSSKSSRRENSEDNITDIENERILIDTPIPHSEVVSEAIQINNMTSNGECTTDVDTINTVYENNIEAEYANNSIKLEEQKLEHNNESFCSNSNIDNNQHLNNVNHSDNDELSSNDSRNKQEDLIDNDEQKLSSNNRYKRSIYDSNTLEECHEDMRKDSRTLTKSNRTLTNNVIENALTEVTIFQSILGAENGNDIKNNKQNSISTMAPLYTQSFYQHKLVEFWELITTLAQMLNVELPSFIRTNKDKIEIPSRLGKKARPKSWPDAPYVRALPSTDDELMASQYFINYILDKIRILLNEIKCQ